MAGFALATATLHALGIGLALGLTEVRMRSVVRAAGAACAVVGVGLMAGVI
jgi:urease accessory protein